MSGRLFLFALFFFCFSLALKSQPKLLRMADVQALPVNIEPVRLAYGSGPEQFGELRLPPGKGPHPVVVIIHGGCWVAAIADLHFMDPMAGALAEAGFATWNLEYRRIGNAGGGWPGTFQDISAGVNFLRQIANRYSLDLGRVIVAGHSAGGHLALWLGASGKLPAQSPVADPAPLPLKGILSLAGIVDPASYLVRNGSGCGANVDELLGGLPEQFPQRYREASPLAMLPLGIRQILLSGERDPIVPPAHIAPYLQAAVAAKDPVEQVLLPGAGHFEVIAPGSIAWPEVEKAVRRLLPPDKRGKKRLPVRQKE